MALRVPRWISAFFSNEVDGEILQQLTADDLKEIGVAAVGHRRKLLEAIAKLGVAAIDGDGADATVAPTVRMAGGAASDPPSRPEAERRQLTVMFADLVGHLSRP